MKKNLIRLAICSMLLVIGYLVGQNSTSQSGGWSRGGAVAVGDSYSIELLTRCSSPIGMAEYDQRLEVYGGTTRDGKSLGTIDLFPNTGGRTHSLVYTYTDDSGRRMVQIQDRYGIEDIDMVTRVVTNHAGGDNTSRSGVSPHPKRVFVGTYSGEAYPLKFVAPAILSEQDSLKSFSR
ncbi:MAG: hypothetical protein H7A52_12775 [Akkermansiaceae bacterium]|nr:hypothetical protein [Akkermansiaceae bacterium]